MYVHCAGSCSGLFSVSNTGLISTAGVIDRDEGDVADSDGVCVLKVMVKRHIMPLYNIIINDVTEVLVGFS